MTKRPARLAPRVTEAALHMSVVRFLRYAWPDDLPWWHTPNGGLRSKAEAGKLRAMGVTPGVPDLCFLLPDRQCAFIELKGAGGHLSPDQIAFRDRVQALGCAYVVARSVEDVEATLNRWLLAYGRKLRARLTPAGAFQLDRAHG